MSRLFISHSSRNDDWAIALRDWLVREGWSGENDVFLDLDPERGIAAGERWARALEDAATRCEAVLYLVSEAWLGSKWCVEEYQLAKELNKKLFALLIDDVPLDRLPGGLTAQWQVVHLKGEPAERFLTVHPRTQEQSPVRMAGSGLASLKRGLEKAGIGAETFQLQPDKNGPFGWRAVYRGLEALEPQDAAVFFGRNADLVRGIDALRGLAARKPPRLLVILGASGAGKSSFLRAGLWPRLLRDDSQWLPLRAIRASRGGALEDDEGLLAALEDVHARLALRTTRAALREAITTPERFIALLQDQRQAAARRAHLDQPPYPLPVLCFDQCEELFAAEAGHESAKLLALARAAIEADAALLLVTIRSDAYGLMQSAAALAGIDQVALPLGPVPQGEIGRIIREPSEVLRGQAGPRAPAFEPAVVEQLQKEVAGEPDALPLLAFVLQRLMRERLGQTVIGLKELEQTGGVAAAIEREAEAALADAGYGQGRAGQRDVLRRLFIPRLVRIDRKSKAPQRRVAWQSDLPADLASLARALTERRLLVARVADAVERGEAGPATLEVAHEAMLRRWQTLADLLAEDRDALLMLDGVLTAANDWEKADDNRKPDFLAHRGSRLADAQALAGRGPDWARENAQAQAYLASCQEREKAEQDEREAALAREQARLAEITAAQARTARFQRQARWTLVTLAAAVTAALGVGVWQYLGNMRTMRDLIAAQEKTARGQAELQLAQAETADRQAQVDRAQAEIARGQAELEVARAETAHRQAQVERGQVSLLAELATSRRLQGDTGPALRLSVHAVRLASHQGRDKAAGPLATAALVLASSVWQAQWRLQLGGHEALVNSVAFSADGTRIVTASEDGTARLWDAATGREVLVLRRRASYLRSAAFSPDGARIVAASGDLTARIWDAATGREVTVLRRHDDAVFSAAFSPDGERIVTASWDKTARLWDAATGRGLAVLRGHEGGVTSAAFSPDGGRIVTASVDKTARLWDAATGREVTVLRGHEGTVLSAAFSPDGARIVTASGDRTARLWDAATRRESRCCAGTRTSVRLLLSAPTAPASSRRQRTGPRGSGMRPPAASSRCCAGTRTVCSLLPSAPTVPASSRCQGTRPGASGMRPRAGTSRCCAGMRALCAPPRSAPTPPASSRC